MNNANELPEGNCNIKQNVYTLHNNDDQFHSKDELQDIIDYISTC